MMRLSVFILLTLLAAACNGRNGEQRILLLTDFVQQGDRSVRLNETLVFRFDHEIDPSSINPSTVSVISSAGEPAEGRWVVQGKEVLFFPQLPIETDGSDAGLVPGQAYSVYFKGFPAYGSILSVEGYHLRQSCTLNFKTITNPRFCTELFVDVKPDSAPEVVSIGGTPTADLSPDGIMVQAGSILDIDFSEPIFPGSVATSKAEIWVPNVESAVDHLPLDIAFGLHGSQLLIQPAGGFQPGKKYKLSRDNLDFTDFGGNPIGGRFNYLDIECSTTSLDSTEGGSPGEEKR